MTLTRQHKWIFIIFACLLFIVFGLYHRYEQRKNIYILSQIENVSFQETTPFNDDASAEAIQLKRHTMVVHIEGMIQHPGVYELDEGARLIDLVHLSGGLLEGASNKVNLAQKLQDESFIFIPSEEEYELSKEDSAPMLHFQPPGASSNTQLVNINTAEQLQLESLPGIGPVLAERIVSYRQQHGPFKVLADLKKVSGIGEKRYQDLESLITI